MTGFDITSRESRARAAILHNLTKAQRECLARVGIEGWARRKTGARRSYGSRPDFAGGTLASLVELGLVEYLVTEYGVTRRDTVVPVGWSAANTATQKRRERVGEATLYVTTRFYPPLPREYGELLVQATEACEDQRHQEIIILPQYINPKPRVAFTVDDDEEGNERWGVRAADLLVSLRCEHLIDGEF